MGVARAAMTVALMKLRRNEISDSRSGKVGETSARNNLKLEKLNARINNSKGNSNARSSRGKVRKDNSAGSSRDSSNSKGCSR